MGDRWVHEVLEAMRVDRGQRLFVLGCFERRVTLYSQQVRALNLADALFRTGELDASAHVAVVGAGVAGLTFAAGAARRGARVTVLEREDRILPLFRYSPNRWLHPRVYDWPLPGWEHERAGLPVLDWKAGTVAEVREQLERQWNEAVAEAAGRLRVIPRAGDVAPGSSEERGVWLAWNAPRAEDSGPELFTAVVLAVGFGLEKEEVPDYRGYWDPDDLDRYETFRPGKDTPKTWLVSGCGDGALTDLLRLCIRDFRHYRMVQDFASLPGVAEAVPAIRKIEGDPRAEGPRTPSFLFDEYRKLRVTSVIKALKDEERRREDAVVTLNVKEAYFLQANSSALNRFLVSQLWHAGRFKFLLGSLMKPVAKEGEHLLVTLEGQPPRPFDKVVVRHGPRPALAAFVGISKASEHRREMWKDAPHLLDQTRERRWDEGVFGAEERFGESHAAGASVVPDIAAPGVAMTDAAVARAAAGASIAGNSAGVAAAGTTVASVGVTTGVSDAVVSTTAVSAIPAVGPALADTGPRPPIATVSHALPTFGAAPNSRRWEPYFAHALERAQHFQGRETHLTELRAWLNAPRSQRRVMALCAIGGTGKTALAEHALMGWLKERDGSVSGASGGVLVWSFYEDDRTDEFLGAACSYFMGQPGDVGGRAERLKDVFRKGEPHLLVLDGMERVQADGHGGRARGEIGDRTLRTLLTLIANGHLGAARVLVTSRFPLCDLEGAGYQEIALDDLDPLAARAVLRGWAVKGEDPTLDDVAERVHRHALSVRVMGAYLGQFRGGDAQVGLALDLGGMAHDISEADKKARKLDGLLAHYATAMRDDERALMARLSLFPRGVAVDVLATVVDAGGKVAGVLVGCDQVRLVMMLERLVKQGLVFGYGARAARVYTAHPFLRDAFRNLVDVPAEEVHEAVRKRLAPSLEEQPASAPTDAETLDRYERLIEVTRLAGKVEEALNLYWFGIGSYANLGTQLGDNTRGARIVAGFAVRGEPGGVAPSLKVLDRAALAGSWGLYAANLGDLRLARRCFGEATGLARQARFARDLSTALRNATELEIMFGRLPAARAFSTEALSVAEQVDHQQDREYSHACVASAHALAGSVVMTRHHFAEATRLEGKPLYSNRGQWEAEFRLRLGDRDGARAQSLSNLALSERLGMFREVARLHTLLGHLALPADTAEARGYLVLARQWTHKTGDLEVALRVHLLAADIAMHTDDPTTALHEVSEGRTLADTHEFGLYAIDLRLALARAHRALQQPREALTSAREALTRSTSPECSYFWGEADAEHLIGLTLRDLGQLAEATTHLERAAAMRAHVGAPPAKEDAPGSSGQ